MIKWLSDCTHDNASIYQWSLNIFLIFPLLYSHITNYDILCKFNYNVRSGIGYYKYSTSVKLASSFRVRECSSSIFKGTAHSYYCMVLPLYSRIYRCVQIQMTVHTPHSCNNVLFDTDKWEKILLLKVLLKWVVDF